MIKYFIAYYGDHYYAWSEGIKEFIPAYHRMYRSAWNSFSDCMQNVIRIRKQFPDKADDIFPDSEYFPDSE